MYLSLLSCVLSALLVWDPVGVHLAGAETATKGCLQAPSIFQDLAYGGATDVLERARVEIAFLLNMVTKDSGIPRQDLNARLDSWRAEQSGALKSIEVLTDPRDEDGSIHLEFTFTSGEFAGQRFGAVAASSKADRGDGLFGFSIYRKPGAEEGAGDFFDRQEYSLSPPEVEDPKEEQPGRDSGKNLYSFTGMELLAVAVLAAENTSGFWPYLWAGCMAAGIVAFIISSVKLFLNKTKTTRKFNINSASEAELKAFLEKVWPGDRKERKSAVRAILKARRKDPIQDLRSIKGIPQELQNALAGQVVCKEAPSRKRPIWVRTGAVLSGSVLVAGVIGMLSTGFEERKTPEGAGSRPRVEKVEYQKGKFFVFFTAHGDASDFEMMRPDLDRVVKASAPEPRRDHMPNLIIIHESILVLESVKRYLDESVDTKNIFKLVYDPEYKEPLRKAYETAMEHDRNYLESLDGISHASRVSETLKYISMQGHSAYDRAYYKWAGYSGARQRSAQLDFEDWYNAMRAQLDNSYDLALFRGDTELFFERFSYKTYHYLYGMKAIRDKAVVGQVAALREEFPEANILYPVGFAHSTNKNIFSSAGKCQFLGGQSSGIARGFSSRITSRYKEDGFLGSRAEKDLLALLYMETAISNLFPEGMPMAEITNMLDDRFAELKKRGITPSRVIVDLAARLAPKKVPEGEVIRSPVKFGHVARELYRMGVLEKSFFKKLGVPEEEPGGKRSSSDNDSSRSSIAGPRDPREAVALARKTARISRGIKSFMDDPRRMGVLSGEDPAPVEIVVDLSLIPEKLADEYAETWARLIWSCRDYEKINFMFKMPERSVKNDLTAELGRGLYIAAGEEAVLGKIRDKIREIAYLNPDSIDIEAFLEKRLDSPVQGAPRISILSSSRLKWMKAEGVMLEDGEYPVAMKGSAVPGDGMFPLLNFEMALTMALLIASMLAMKGDGSPERESGEVSLDTAVLVRKVREIYSLSGEGLNITEETLRHMISSSVTVRMNLALAVAIPPVARLDAQSFAETHERIKLTLFAA